MGGSCAISSLSMMSSMRCSLRCRRLRPSHAASTSGRASRPPSVLARKITAIYDAPEPTVVPKFRDGDVRAASCDIEPAKNNLHWRPKWALEDGLHALLEWIGGQPELPFEPSDHTCIRPS